ncbi:MAG: hypothetical protein GY768_01380 [Planctomycetaceae bacterium]|nr:hypothetical protein [Planctomycetaceae bacterium]
MNAPLLNAGICRLIQFKASAKSRRMLRGFTNPRRVIWSIIGLILAILWFSNALTIVFRQSADIEQFRKWIPLGLLAYAFWHLIKVAFQRPEEAIEWTSAERELLSGGPFQRWELIIYRLAGVASAGLVKSLLFTVLMLPELSLFFAAFTGTFLALIFLDLIRLSVEVTANGMSNLAYLVLRSTTTLIILVIVVCSLTIASNTPVALPTSTVGLSLGLMGHIFQSTASLAETPLGETLIAPFQVFSQLITATSYSAATLGWLVIAATMVSGSLVILIRLDQYFSETIQQREEAAYPPHPPRKRQAPDKAKAASQLVRIPQWYGGGPVAWRQIVGAFKQRSSLIFALALPGGLACLPLYVYVDGTQAVLSVAAALVFYTFLLLPSALKFDFRRDIRRMIVLKTLPIRPIFLVAGQITTPVALAFVFQLSVLIITMLTRPYPIWIMVTILVLLAPLNILIFALDNLVYLLYPYRLNQEGIEILLRTTLTFTAKGLLFTIALAMTFAWGFIANFLSRSILHTPSHSAAIFIVGMGLMLCGTSAILLHGLSLAFQYFDPSQDTPA